MDTEKGIKFDSEKIRWTLLPLEELEEVVQVLEHGARKYAPDNWKKVRPAWRYADAAFRHLVAFVMGERIDPDSGLHHLAHCACNILFLLWHDKNTKNLKENS